MPNRYYVCGGQTNKRRTSYATADMIYRITQKRIDKRLLSKIYDQAKAERDHSKVV
jgi:hypothetical protein